ncbi:hypothetical protein RSAG8_09725, partial [Rhizoctonia solani AG-8 WAC10335]
MAANNRSQPSIKVRISGEPPWGCTCKPEANCQLVVEVPPMPLRYRSIVWTLPPRRTPVTTSQDTTEAPGEAAVTQSVPIKKPTSPLREVSLPPIATLDSPNPVADGVENEEEELEWESEEQVDELLGNE